MTLHLGFRSSSHDRHAQQQQEIRDARKVLKECVRTDWDYPSLPAYQTTKRVRPNVPPSNTNDKIDQVESKIAGFRLHHTSAMYLQPKDWTHRECSCESSSDEGEDEGDAEIGKKGSDSSSQDHREGKTEDRWRFEGPDSVGTEIQDRQNTRKRKRQRALEEEMAWNDGLALWAARRDAWCEARTIEQIRAAELGVTSQPSSTGHISTTSTNTAVAASSSSTSSSGSSPRSSTSTSTRSDSAISPATSPDLEPHITSDSFLKSSTTTTSYSSTSPVVPGSPDILIPIAQPLLANHPIRRRITPAVWPEIYSKIVLQGRAPSVPINLLTMTRALVQGWQSEGEWPPKPGPVERTFTHKKSGQSGKWGNGEDGKSGGLRMGVRAAVERVLRISSDRDSGVVPPA